MLRYRNLDDFGETTSAFTICSFWWAEALALAGRLDEAIAVFERAAAPREPGRPVLARTSIRRPARCSATSRRPTRTSGLIHAAMTIGELLDARDGRVRAWA